MYIKIRGGGKSCASLLFPLLSEFPAEIVYFFHPNLLCGISALSKNGFGSLQSNPRGICLGNNYIHTASLSLAYPTNRPAMG